MNMYCQGIEYVWVCETLIDRACGYNNRSRGTQHECKDMLKFEVRSYTTFKQVLCKVRSFMTMVRHSIQKCRPE